MVSGWWRVGCLLGHVRLVGCWWIWTSSGYDEPTPLRGYFELLHTGTTHLRPLGVSAMGWPYAPSIGSGAPSRMAVISASFMTFSSTICFTADADFHNRS